LARKNAAWKRHDREAAERIRLVENEAVVATGLWCFRLAYDWAEIHEARRLAEEAMAVPPLPRHPDWPKEEA
jgi:hypothetical protein